MWVRIDDQVPHHPKFIQAGPTASWLWVCGNCHCSKYLTDGFIAEPVVRGLGQIPNAYKHAASLVTVGLWEVCEGGYRVHDYDHYNPTAEEVQAVRKVRAEQGRRGGLAKALAIRQANSQHVAKQIPSKPLSKNVADPIPSQKKTTEQSSAEPKDAPPVTEFLLWFQEEYKKRRNGATYCIVWAKHGAIIKRLLLTYSPERLRKLAAILLSSTVDEWIADSDRGIEVLAGKINWLEERLAGWEAQKRGREAV